LEGSWLNPVVARPYWLLGIGIALVWQAIKDTDSTRERMKGFFPMALAFVMPLMFPMWLLFGLGNYVAMKLAPEASWPPGVDEESRR
jgi:hypothetical protein